MRHATHTPGPWIVDEDYEDREQLAIPIIKEGQGYIAGIHSLASAGKTALTQEDRANARLIASAPELLNALELALATIERLKPAKPYDSTQGTRDVCNAAIHHATGRQAKE